MKTNRMMVLATIIAVAANVSLFAGDFRLHTAVFFGNAAEVKRLVGEEKLDINQKDNNGWTPVYRAVSNNKLEMVKLLVSCGADVRVQCNDGETPVYRAVWKNNLDRSCANFLKI